MFITFLSICISQLKLQRAKRTKNPKKCTRIPRENGEEGITTRGSGENRRVDSQDHTILEMQESHEHFRARVMAVVGELEAVKKNEKRINQHDADIGKSKQN
uniref:Uncharacterized protein n=1 Tax=Photinus pyralis TaxID=7054 RepID=A0A1Y1NA02_PHOPY